jgi:lipopolysaccharide transport system permease protein
VDFPRLAVPLASVGAVLVDTLIASGLLLALMRYHGIVPGFSLLLAPLLLAIMLLAAVGVGTLLAALNVAYRDFRYVIPFLTQFWMFATPTVYMQPDADASGPLQVFLTLNPMTSLVAAFRAAVLGGTGGPIDWAQVAIAAMLSTLAFLVGCLYFRRVEDSFADII